MTFSSDIWLIFCLLMPFIIFLIEVSWELMKQKENDKVSKIYHKSKINKARCKIAFQVAIPVLCGLFFTVYVLLAFLKYFSFRNDFQN